MSAGEIDNIFNYADYYKKHLTAYPETNFRSETFIKENRIPILCNLFYEPSSRTSGSFHSAMMQLGGHVLPVNSIDYSSVSKGESLEDTIRTFANYSDVIVLRHPEKGAAERAAEVSSVPIINAGDGSGEHPTQALIDAYTMLKLKGDDILSISFKKSAIVGDLKNGRTVHSLVKIIDKTNYRNTFFFISPKEYQLPDEIKNNLDSKYVELENLVSIHTNAFDFLYVTRVQTERGSSFAYRVAPDVLDFLNSDCHILHPFPRNDELPPEIDDDPRAKYFEQMQNGLYVRMATLYQILRINS